MLSNFLRIHIFGCIYSITYNGHSVTPTTLSILQLTHFPFILPTTSEGFCYDRTTMVLIALSLFQVKSYLSQVMQLAITDSVTYDVLQKRRCHRQGDNTGTTL